MRRDGGAGTPKAGEPWIWGRELQIAEGGLVVHLGLQVIAGCEWEYDYEECQRYLKVAVDTCDCQGVNGKHGGKVENDCLLWWLDPNKYYRDR